MLNILNEKIDIFEVTAAMTYAGANWSAPADLYRIGTLIYNDIEVERINKNEFLYINASPLLKPTDTRPIFVSGTTGYKVYGSLIVRASNSTLNGAITASSTIVIAAANPSISKGNIITGTGIVGAVTVTSINADGITITISSAQTLANNVVLTFTTPAPTQLISAGVTCNYIKRPATAVWGYTTINGAALYNSTSSIDFPLHESEETELVVKILEFASLSIRDINLYQVSSQMEAQNTQQEKS